MASSPPYHPSPSNGLSLRGLIEEAELLAEAIVDTVRESLLVLDHSLHIRLASRSFYLTFCVSPEETLDRLVYEVGEGQWNIPRLRQFLEDILPHNGGFRDFEVTHEFPKIGRRTMLLNARKLRRREDQEELILLAIEDVTALQEAQERDAFAAAVLRSSGEALVGLSAEGVIRSWNPAAIRLFGYTAEEALGSSISILAPASLEAEQRDVLTRLRTGETMTTETVRLTKAGRPVTVILNAAPVLDSTGQMIGISAALTDITERKQMEQQLRESEQNLSALLKEKQTLVQEIHHRVKNNLQMVVSLLHLHAGQTTDRLVIEALSEAGNRVQAIARLHETLYASSNLAELNFGEYLRDLTNELQRVQGRADISVQVFTEDILLGMDTAIPLGLIANELILNCLKHAFPAGRRGRVTVSVEYVRDSVKSGESLDGAAIRLRVQDDGIGLPPGLDIDRTNSLGLRLVQLLARQLHAAVQTQTGTGLTWTVSVPPPPRLTSRWNLNLEQARILIVEDEALIAEDLRRTVVLLGYAVVAVTDSGEEAVQRARELRPDLVLLDFKLRGPMNGVEAGALIQQSVASVVVYVSANAEVLQQPYVVRKPFSRATLSRAITAALAAR